MVRNEAIRATVIAVQEFVLPFHVTRKIQEGIPRRTFHCESESAREFFKSFDESDLSGSLNRAISATTNEFDGGFRRKVLTHDEVARDHQSSSSEPRVTVN